MHLSTYLPSCHQVPYLLTYLHSNHLLTSELLAYIGSTSYKMGYQGKSGIIPQLRFIYNRVGIGLRFIHHQVGIGLSFIHNWVDIWHPVDGGLVGAADSLLSVRDFFFSNTINLSVKSPSPSPPIPICFHSLSPPFSVVSAEWWNFY